MDARSLWNDSLPTAEACLAHAFVTGIADGRLPRASFEHYIAQDAFFLDAFARAYALGLARTADRPTMRRFKTLLDGAMDEQTLHETYARRWGVDLDPQPTPATRAYTDFLLQVAALEPLGHLVAAMTPCMRLYAWLGQSLEHRADPASAYHEWVQTYASAAFDELAVTMEQLLDDLAATADHPDALAARYRTAMDLERAFFDSAHAVATTQETR